MKLIYKNYLKFIGFMSNSELFFHFLKICIKGRYFEYDINFNMRYYKQNNLSQFINPYIRIVKIIKNSKSSAMHI